ncbi:MAG TPA: fluoride efflux transporter CrcB [Candidatus Eisenbacteria bacterium]|nr:fluoride efflux transporter CrcB [Candidatus Eisenbacteria bacterium]
MTSSVLTFPGWIALAACGAAGTLCRYALGGWMARATGGTFPWETCVINLSGCLVIGAIAAAVDRGAAIPPATRIAIMVGFLGGYTTFSSFGLESFRLLADAQWARALAYVALSNVGGLACVWAGYRALQLWG